MFQYEERITEKMNVIINGTRGISRKIFGDHGAVNRLQDEDDEDTYKDLIDPEQVDDSLNFKEKKEPRPKDVTQIKSETKPGISKEESLPDKTTTSQSFKPPSARLQQKTSGRRSLMLSPRCTGDSSAGMFRRSSLPNVLCGRFDSTSYTRTISDDEIPMEHCIRGSQKEQAEFRWVYRQALKGHATECFALGYEYDTGSFGVEINSEEAIHWYLEAASRGHAIAMNNLGVIYATGHGGSLPERPAEALYWYKLSANRGYAAAQFHVGLMLISGKGVEQCDATEAFCWFKRAAKQSHVLGLANVGAMYMNGKGVPKNYRKAKKWLRKAANKGSTVAMHNLGVLLWHGLAGKKDEKAGLKLMEAACSENREEPVPRELSEQILKEAGVLMNL